MAKVVNLNRYRKRRAREEKEKQADRNRRLHGRTKGERALESANKKRLEKKIDGAFLVRDRVPVQGMVGDAEQTLLSLERATRRVLTLSEYAARLRKSPGAESPPGVEPSPGAEQGPAVDGPKEDMPAGVMVSEAPAPDATPSGTPALDAPAPDATLSGTPALDAPAPDATLSGTPALDARASDASMNEDGANDR